LPTTVVFLLKLLHGKGLLQPGIWEASRDGRGQAHWLQQLRFLSHFVQDAPNAQAVLERAHIGIAGSEKLRKSIISSLASIGVSDPTELHDARTWRSDAGGNGHELAKFDLLIACEESPAFDFFDAINQACLASGTRWLRVLVSGTSAQLGPTFVPGETACHTCLDLRLRTHEQELEGYLAYRAHVDRPSGRIDEGSIAPLCALVAAQATLEAMRLLVGFTPPVTVGRFYVLKAASPEASSHEVFRVARCPSCGRRRTFAQAWDEELVSPSSKP
jgi:bacteriocin biosynthesis cyclodehydratase domain-containing protein